MALARKLTGIGYWTSLHEDERIRRILDFRQAAATPSIIRRRDLLYRSDVHKRGGVQSAFGHFAKQARSAVQFRSGD
jgi:hypothetical protein